MNRNISALEKSRQILKELELEDKRNNNAKKPNMADIAAEPQDESSEGISFEGIQRKRTESKPVNENTEPDNILNIDQQNIVNGIILSEILGKPVSRRRGRW